MQLGLVTFLVKIPKKYLRLRKRQVIRCSKSWKYLRLMKNFKLQRWVKICLSLRVMGSKFSR